MWPWGHLAVGYLLYALVCHYRFDRPPVGVAVLLVLIGMQFPDLVDKPLAWTLPFLPSGRTLAHTLFVAVPLSLAVYAYCQRHGRPEWGVAFGLGYLSHAAADALQPLLTGEFAGARFLLWPADPAPPYDESTSIVSHFLAMELTPWVAFEMLLFLVAVVVWAYDGKPGLATLRAAWDRSVATR